MTVNDTFWIIGEIIVGIALLGLLSAAVTAVMVPLLSKTEKRSGAAEILAGRYARGELTREQYAQMREDLGIGTPIGASFGPEGSNGRETIVGPGARPMN